MRQSIWGMRKCYTFGTKLGGGNVIGRRGMIYHTSHSCCCSTGGVVVNSPSSWSMLLTSPGSGGGGGIGRRRSIWMDGRKNVDVNIHIHGHRQSSILHTIRCFGSSQVVSSSSVFVSKHNQSLQLTGHQIKDWCQSHGMTDIRTTNSHVIVRECPFCVKPTNNQADNLYKLYIQIGGGAYFCHRCGAKGSWFDFKNHASPQPTITTPFSSTSSSTNNNRYTKDDYSRNNSSFSRQLQQQQQQLQSQQQQSSSQKLPMPVAGLAGAYNTNLLDTQSEVNDALDYLTDVRGLKKETLRKYCVGKAFYNFPTAGGRYVKAECITFPWNIRSSELAEQEQPPSSTNNNNNNNHKNTKLKSKDSNTTIQDNNNTDNNKNDDEGLEQLFVNRRIKARALSNKAWQRLDPPGGGWGFFGWHTVPADATEIIITEGEYDAMAVYQATGRPAISLPNGCRSLPLQVLPLLERFQTIYLWMDNDGPGREGAEQFAKKIGIDRCLIVQPSSSSKDANEALLLNLDLEQMLQSATILPHEQIMSFQELRDQVFAEIVDPDKYAGVPSTTLPSLTKIIKGFRRGEMTVLTGPTGSGKTTFLGQLSIDLAEQGVNTLWGSFEIKNTRLMRKLLQQFAKQPLPDFGSSSSSNNNNNNNNNNDQQQQEDDRQKVNVLMDRFESLPLQYMKFHGGSDIDDVLDAMEYAAYVHDSQHFILDNMQFMISRDALSSSSLSRSNFDKFDVQDAAVEKFRKFATEKNVHVTLVVHPRKEEEFQRLSISSIYGSAKATQEADTVLILQNDGRRKFLDVKKNRFDGTTGTVPLHFHRPSNTYTEQPIIDTTPPPSSSNNNNNNNQTNKTTKLKTKRIPTTTTNKTVQKSASIEDNIIGAYYSGENKDDDSIF